jgi:hypothetical protein
MATVDSSNPANAEDVRQTAEARELHVLEALEQAAAAVGVAVRYDKLATGDVRLTSGACKIRGRETIIVDRRLSPRERIAALARELSRYDFEQVFLPPAARELIEPPSGGLRREKA